MVDFNMLEDNRTTKFRSWALVFTCWSAVALLDTLGSHTYYVVAGIKPPSWRWLFTINCGGAYAMAVLTPAIHWIDQRFPLSRERWVRSSVVQILAGGTCALAAASLTALCNYLFSVTRSLAMGSVTSQIAGIFLNNVPRYALVVAICEATRYYRSDRERQQTAAQLTTQLAEARLSALKMQLHPHFIFNALNAIATLSRRDPASSEQMTLELAELLRMSLQQIDEHEVPLDQELRFLQSYLRIQTIRFADRLTVEIQVEPVLLRAAVPHLILQPIVENAIHHGIGSRSSPGRVLVRAGKIGSRLTLEVYDDGPGMPVGESGYICEGVGLRNTRARLKQTYGPNFRFSYGNRLSGGCCVFISIPFRVTDRPIGGCDADSYVVSR